MKLLPCSWLLCAALLGAAGCEPTAVQKAADLGPGALVPADASSVALLLENVPTCANCIAGLYTALAPLPGVYAVDAEPNEARIQVHYDPQRVRVDELIAALQAAGEPARLAP